MTYREKLEAELKAADAALNEAHAARSEADEASREAYDAWYEAKIARAKACAALKAYDKAALNQSSNSQDAK